MYDIILWRYTDIDMGKYKFLLLLFSYRERDRSVGKSSASHAGDTVLNPGGGLTWFTPMHQCREKITSCKSHIASVSVTD